MQLTQGSMYKDLLNLFNTISHEHLCKILYNVVKITGSCEILLCSFFVKHLMLI